MFWNLETMGIRSDEDSVYELFAQTILKGHLGGKIGQ